MNALKCVYCKSIIKSPILLPCRHSICNHHLNNCEGSVFCGCGEEHKIPTSGNFPQNQALEEIIESRAEEIDYCPIYKDTKQTCDKLEDIIKSIDEILMNPAYFVYNDIFALKMRVDVQREELKRRIDEEADRVHKKLDDCHEWCKRQLSTVEFSNATNKLSECTKVAKELVDKCYKTLDEWKCDENGIKQLKMDMEKENEKLNENVEAIRKQVFCDLLYEKYRVSQFDKFTIPSFSKLSRFCYFDYKNLVI